MSTTLGRLERLAVMRRVAIPFISIEALAVLIEKTTGRDPMPDWIDVTLACCGLCALVLVAVAEMAGSGLNRRIAADERDLASRREDDRTFGRLRGAVAVRVGTARRLVR
jgi:hypothetical protein